MKKAVIGIVLGAVVYFAVGMVEWMVLPWHNPVIKRIKEETLVRDTLNVVMEDPGMYVFPSAFDKEGNKIQPKEYSGLYRAGPTGVIFFAKAGAEPMGMGKFAVGIGNAILLSAFCFLVLALSRHLVVSIGSKVFLVIGLGVFQWLASHIPYWNWFAFPTPYILIVLLDSILSFGALGLVLAAFSPKQ